MCVCVHVRAHACGSYVCSNARLFVCAHHVQEFGELGGLGRYQVDEHEHQAHDEDAPFRLSGGHVTVSDRASAMRRGGDRV